MAATSDPRLQHLRRLTNARGLVRAARGDCPDRFSGYDAVDNAEALRLCAMTSDTVLGETMTTIAKTCFDLLWRGRRDDGGVGHHCDARGQWHDRDNDELVQARTARALAAVMVSELPIKMRLVAADWWRELTRHADRVVHPCAAGHWLIAFGQLRAAHPGRDLDRVHTLAHWLVEECYYPTRCSEWEWFAPQWYPGAACIPTGLWHAAELLDEVRFRRVAKVSTAFLIDHCFDKDSLRPVGSIGGWAPGQDKAPFNQMPGETLSMVELLRTAERIGGWSEYRRLADRADAWFEGDNVKHVRLIDSESGGCHDAITADGLSPDQGGAAVCSYLLTRATMTADTIAVEDAIDPTVRIHS